MSQNHTVHSSNIHPSQPQSSSSRDTPAETQNHSFCLRQDIAKHKHNQSFLQVSQTPMIIENLPSVLTCWGVWDEPPAVVGIVGKQLSCFTKLHTDYPTLTYEFHNVKIYRFNLFTALLTIQPSKVHYGGPYFENS